MPYKTSRRVQFRDTDAAGIMHFSTFFTYMEQAEHEMLRSVGLSVADHQADLTFSWPRVSATCDYKQALRFEDLFEISVRVARLGTKSVTYEFTFHQPNAANQVLAVGNVTAVYCKFEKGKPPVALEIPASFREKIKAFET
jgi:acyl-CoA thioester hydrolase